VPRSVVEPLRTDWANTHGTVAMLAAARDAGVRRVVYASSSSVYGGVSDGPASETLPPRPRSPYAVSKLAAEQYCRVFTELGYLETVALRYFNVFGPRQRADSAYAAVIPLFVEALSTGMPAMVHGDGLQRRDFTYVSDVVAANLAAATVPAARCTGKVYNVAGGDGHSLLDLLELLGKLLGQEPERIHVEPRPGDIRQSWADISAARQDLRYEPQVTFEDGLRATLGWFAVRS
jgi:UDP-glucose 4-epimerase